MSDAISKSGVLDLLGELKRKSMKDSFILPSEPHDTIETAITHIESGSFDLPPGAEYNRALDDVKRIMCQWEEGKCFNEDEQKLLRLITLEIESLRRGESEICEGCGKKEASRYTTDDVHLCSDCYDELSKSGNWKESGEL